MGFRLPNQDPEGIARGNAFAATADNASAIYYNPAGITQLEGDNFRVGAYFVSAGIEYTSPSGVTAHPKSDFQPVPEIYYVHSLKESPFSFGLGVYSPYGLSVDWGKNSPFGTLAEKGQVIYACFNPVVAWKITPSLSLAIGPTINYSEASFVQAFPAFTPDGTFHFRGDGTAYGFNAGLRWQPLEQLSFGLNYRSETEVEYEGTSEAQPLPRTATHGPLRYPQFVVAGVSYRPTADWNFEVNIDWTDWARVNDIVFNGTALGNIPLPLNLKSSFMYEFGVTRQLGKGYFGSVGYFYSENSSPSEYFNPILPDSNLQLGSIGFGHRGKRWDWAVAYHFGYNGERNVIGSPTSAFGQSADGKYETLNHAFNIAVGFKF
ncbi:MAG TPA: outer membrane protein transport protein [Candidatus Limnocylindria bacterium]|nr:outer membrane protein transport protein [Candidatus Limnocylindria bacterium]